MNFIKKYWFCLLLIGIMLIITYSFYMRALDAEAKILYDYESVPDIELGHNLITDQFRSIFWGKITGHVKFADSAKQPKSAKQYFILEALDKYDSYGKQKFVLDDMLVLPTMPPTSTGKINLFEESYENDILTLVDESQNKYKIHFSKKMLDGDVYLVSDNFYMLDAKDGLVQIITSDMEFRQLIRANY